MPHPQACQLAEIGHRPAELRCGDGPSSSAATDIVPGVALFEMAAAGRALAALTALAACSLVPLVGGGTAASAQQAQQAQPALPAFPGAEGFGAVASGGRGGDVSIVTTLEPFGAGSLGDALDPEVCRPRVVVFRVSGVIPGEFDLTCGDITIAGQTAPGAGVTIRGRIDGYGAAPGGNIVIRHLRVRPAEPEPDKAGFHDAIQLSNNPRVILDHVSASWGADEVIDFFEGTGDITIQWSTIEESRTEGNPDGPHNKGLIVGPGVQRVSIHHVLFAHHRDRCPAVASGPAEVVNTVAYDCKDSFVHHNPADGEFHVVGNTYRRGPSVEPDDFVPFFFDDEEPGGVAYYVAGNLIDDPGVLEGVIDDIWTQPFAHPNFEYAGGEEYRTDDPTDFSAENEGHVPITVDEADAAYEAVLSKAGAFPRDAVTTRTVEEVRERGGAWGVNEPADLLAGLRTTDPPDDEDADGMAYAWEREHGLDPSNPSDHAQTVASGYTAVEEYVNELAEELAAAAPAATPGATAGATASETPPDEAVDQTAPDLPDLTPAQATVQGQPPAASPLAAAALALSIVAVVLATVALVIAARARR